MSGAEARYLLDENLPPQVAAGLSLIGYELYCVGTAPAPARRSTDETNVKWCVERDVILVTEDRGRKNREILDLMARHRVHVIRVPQDVTAKELARFILRHHETISDALDTCRRRGGTVRRKIGRNGGMTKL